MILVFYEFMIDAIVYTVYIIYVDVLVFYEFLTDAVYIHSTIAYTVYIMYVDVSMYIRHSIHNSGMMLLLLCCVYIVRIYNSAMILLFYEFIVVCILDTVYIIVL